MSKNNTEFREFLRDYVNINQSRLDSLHDKVRAVIKYLKRNLHGYQRMEPQGSLALRTIIKPVKEYDEFDADIQVVMNPNSEWEPRDYLKEVYDTLKENKNYADKLELKTRCVRIKYAGDFHMDLVPRITENGNHYIFNRVENEKEITDGNGYREWFNDKNRITDGNLKRVTRLLKFHRNHKRTYSVASILLTTLIGETIRKSDEGEEAVRTTADTLVTVLTRMDEYLQKHPSMPEIRNPVLAEEEPLTRHWDQRRYANFRERVHAHTKIARAALKEKSPEKAVDEWQKLFGDNFGRGRGKGGGGKKSAAIGTLATPKARKFG